MTSIISVLATTVAAAGRVDWEIEGCRRRSIEEARTCARAEASWAESNLPAARGNVYGSRIRQTGSKVGLQISDFRDSSQFANVLYSVEDFLIFHLSVLDFYKYRTPRIV